MIGVFTRTSSFKINLACVHPFATRLTSSPTIDVRKVSDSRYRLMLRQLLFIIIILLLFMVIVVPKPPQVEKKLLILGSNIVLDTVHDLTRFDTEQCQYCLSKPKTTLASVLVFSTRFISVEWIYLRRGESIDPNNYAKIRIERLQRENVLGTCMHVSRTAVQRSWQCQSTLYWATLCLIADQIYFQKLMTSRQTGLLRI
jgi:hypothetical protein